MRLERNSGAGKGKYAVVNLREVAKTGVRNPDIATALSILENNGLLQYGAVGTEDEFFVLKLKDIYSGAALHAYAAQIENDPKGDLVYADDIRNLARRAGRRSHWCKLPD